MDGHLATRPQGRCGRGRADFAGVARLFVYDIDGNLVVDGARTTEFGRALEIHVIDDLP